MFNEETMLAVFEKAEKAFRARKDDFTPVTISIASLDEVNALNTAIDEGFLVQAPCNGLVLFTKEGRAKFAELLKANEDRQDRRKSIVIAEQALFEAQKANKIAVGANTRATWTMWVSIVCAVISSGSLISVLSFWLSGK